MALTQKDLLAIGNLLETKHAFVKYRAGYANALCVIQTGVCILLYFLQRYISKKGGMEDE